MCECVKNTNKEGFKGKEMLEKGKALRKGLSLWDSPPCSQNLSWEPLSLRKEESKWALEIYHGQDTEFPPPTHRFTYRTLRKLPKLSSFKKKNVSLHWGSVWFQLRESESLTPSSWPWEDITNPTLQTVGQAGKPTCRWCPGWRHTKTTPIK